MKCFFSLCFSAVISFTSFAGAAEVEILPGTKPLTIEGDIAAQLVAGVDKFLLRELDKSVERRAKHWKRDFSSAEAYNKSIEPNRKRLAHILGVRDRRVPFDAPELVGTTTRPALVGKGDGFNIYAVRWPVLGFPGPTWKQAASIYGEGLLLVPTKGKPIADIIAIIGKFVSSVGAPSKARADLEPALPDQTINIADALSAVSAFSGLPYPFAPGPPPCGHGGD